MNDASGTLSEDRELLRNASFCSVVADLWNPKQI